MLRARWPTITVLSVLLCLVGAAGSQAEDGYIKQARDSYGVFVIGDALAGGLFAGMERMARGDQRLKVTGRYKEDSGLARPEIYDWPEALRKIYEQQEIDIAVVLLGSNDGQDMRPGGESVAFGSPGWSEAYETQMNALLDVFKEHGTAVYWVSNPPMADPEYEARMRTIAEKQATVLKSKGIRLVDIKPQFSAPDGGYTDSGNDINGAFIRLRAKNGVNFYKAGNDKLGKIVLDAIVADFATAGQVKPEEAPPPETPQATSEAPSEQTSTLPMFGQGLVSGEAETLKSDALPPVGAVAVNRSASAKGDRAVTFDETEASAGGSAAALFTSGRWPTPKPGRFDDFAATSR